MGAREEAPTSPQERRFADLHLAPERPPSDPRLSEADLASRFHHRIRLFAARRVQDAAAADDIAQETLRCVLHALRANHLENPDALAAFIFQTARNVCLHWVRSVARERAAFDRLEREASSPSERLDALGTLISAERAHAVRAALHSLGPADRQLLSALYYDNVDGAELAARLGISVSALRVRKHRALQRLAARLDRTD